MVHENLKALLRSHLAASSLQWLAAQKERSVAEEGLRPFVIAFGKARKQAQWAGEPPVGGRLVAEQISGRTQLLAEKPEQVLRLLFLLELQDWPWPQYRQCIQTLFHYGAEEELRLLYRSLSVLRSPESWQDQAREGVRTNMVSVFEALAFENTYPADHLPEAAFNQLVLKALFQGLEPLRIVGGPSRKNADLSRMLMDFADERMAAGRSVPLQLWAYIDSSHPERTLRYAWQLAAMNQPPYQEAAAYLLHLVPSARGADQVVRHLPEGAHEAVLQAGWQAVEAAAKKAAQQSE